MTIPCVAPGRVQTKLLLAALLVVIGVGLAVRSLLPVIRTHDHDAPAAPLTEAAAQLGPDLLDPDWAGDETPESIVSRAVQEAKQQLTQQTLSRVLSEQRHDDLLAAFGERLIATLDGQFERDMRARVARGMATPIPTGETLRENYRKTADWTRHSRIGSRHIEVRIISDAGIPVAPNPAAEGYAALSYTKKGPLGFPVSSDPQSDGYDVVEIRLPMGLKPVDGKSRGAVLVGYQFAWSNPRGQWIPLRNVIYRAPGERYAALPF